MPVTVDIILTLEFLIGFYLQTKKIKRVKQERAVSWEIEIYHSIVCMTHFGLVIMLNILGYANPVISDNTAHILCTCGRYAITWSVTAIMFHSLSVTVYKYRAIIIKGIEYRHEKPQKLLCVFIIIFPILWTALEMLVKGGGTPALGVDFISKTIPICRKVNFESGKPNPSDKSLFCGFRASNDIYNDDWYIIYYVTEFYCLLQFYCIPLLINANIIEAFLYFIIFRFMER